MQREGDSLRIAWRGEPVADYFLTHPKVPRPFFSKLHAPDGTQLIADTEYEFSLSMPNNAATTVTARTWGNRFPIASTTVLAKGVRIGNQRNVVIEGCDIAGWGRRDPQAGKTLRLSGKDCVILPNLGLYLDAGIRIAGPDSTQIIVQGCRIHHPRYTANNWTQASPYFSKNGTLSTHPQGADAIVFAERTGGRHVIRWNELDGGDYDHMFNDALLAAEPKGNGFVGDGDIYGNRIAHCWDDGIEAERGERNMRIWGNHFSDVIKFPTLSNASLRAMCGTALCL